MEGGDSNLNPQNSRDDVGILRIEWRSNTGGSGAIVTPPIKRVVPRQKEFHLSLGNIPSSVQLEVPFSVSCKITNASAHKLTPRLCVAAEKQAGVMINGVSGRSLGTIEPGGSVETTLNLFPMFPGLQSISGIRIVEQQFDKRYEFDQIADVFVQHT